MAITRVGKSSPAASSGSNLTVTATYSSTGGNTLIAAVQHQGGALATPAITDSAGNTWVKGVDTWDIGASGTRRLAIWYCMNAAAVTSVTATGTAAFVRLFVEEINGAIGYRGGATATSGSASPPAAAVTGVKNGDYVYGVIGYFEDTPGSREDTLVTAGGYAELDSYDASTTTYMASAFDIRSSDGDSGPSWTMSPAQTTAGATVAFYATNVDYVVTIDDIVAVTDLDNPFTLDISETIAESVGMTDVATGPLADSKADSVGVTDVVTAVLTRAGVSSTLPNPRVEVAFDAGYTGTPTWTDVTDRVRVDPGISIDHWRGDEDSDTQPSRLSLVLRNDDGRFTPGKTASPYYPDVKKGRRIRVVTERNGVEYTRFYGYVDAWRVDWPGKSASIADCAVTASSRLARLGRGTEMRSIIEEELLADSPAAYYTLGEPEGVTQASDSSGNLQPPLAMVGSGADVAFGSATGPGTDDLTAATFAGGKGLAATVSGVTPTAIWMECCFSSSSSSVMYLIDTYGAALHSAFIGLVGGKLRGLVQNNAGATVIIDSVASVNDGLTHHGLLVASNGGPTTLYLDGVAVGTDATSVTLDALNVVSVGVQAATPDGAPFTGTIAHAAFGYTELDALRAADHAAAGLTGFVGETAAARLSRYARSAGIDSAETDFETGQVHALAHIDTTDQTAIAAMRLVETTEGGVLFDGLDGTLKFHDRAHRYAATSAFTVSYADGEVANPITPVDDDQQQVNEMTAANAAGVTARVVDQASKDEHGSYKDSVDLSTTDPDEPHHRASWVVGTRAEPAVRISEVEVLVNTADDTLAAGVLSAEVGTMFTLTGLPSNAPASSMRLFVEGRSERITADEDRVTLRTSPAEPYDVWILDDATYSVLGTTTRLAY